MCIQLITTVQFVLHPYTMIYIYMLPVMSQSSLLLWIPFREVTCSLRPSDPWFDSDCPEA